MASQIKGLTTPLPTNPAHFDITQVIRPNILALEPYRCARDDFDEGILLDANENALGHAIPVRTGFSLLAWSSGCGGAPRLLGWSLVAARCCNPVLTLVLPLPPTSPSCRTRSSPSSRPTPSSTATPRRRTSRSSSG